MRGECKIKEQDKHERNMKNENLVLISKIRIYAKKRDPPKI